MRSHLTILGSLVAALAVGAFTYRAHGRPPSASPTPADGHTIHVLAPHVVNGQVSGPYHHYCKVVSPEPFIECLIYLSTDSNANLVQIEYIVAKTVTRTNAIPLAVWNKNWHDHAQEIATGRVQVLDLPPDDAKKVADLVAQTDGIIFDLWPHGAKVPDGSVRIGQSVGHVNLTPAEKFKFSNPAPGNR